MIPWVFTRGQREFLGNPPGCGQHCVREGKVNVLVALRIQGGTGIGFNCSVFCMKDMVIVCIKLLQFQVAQGPLEFVIELFPRKLDYYSNGQGKGAEANCL